MNRPRIWMVRLLVAGMLSMALGGTVFAQSYAIRVVFNTNLRASYSLESAVLSSARAGTTLQVVGQHGRWLRVQRDGAEYWMASWVRHERVEQTQTQQQQTNIDNCCFVDRQCATDQEWVDGYWAFQNGQCAAPVADADTNANAARLHHRACRRRQLLPGESAMP